MSTKVKNVNLKSSVLINLSHVGWLYNTQEKMYPYVKPHGTDEFE